MTDVLLQNLRVRFRETARVRMQEMFVQLDAIERDPHDSPVVRQLAHHFHGLAGLGATYGYPRVSELADEGEATILPLAKNGVPPPLALVGRWRWLVEAMAEEISEEAESDALQQAVLAATPKFEILIVESDARLAAELRAAIEQEGITVRVAGSCADARLALERQSPDALLAEARLPDGSGHELLEALRSSRETEGVGAIILSEEHDFIDKVRAIRSGADAFVGKPIDIPSVVRRVLAFRQRKEHPPRRILAVEDDATQAMLILRILGAAGYEVVVCDDPSTFEERLISFGPDLLLMDVQLAGYDVNGYDLVRYIRQSDGFSMLPVIFVTGETERQAVIDSAVSGGDLLIPKPVDWDLLLTQIASRLQRATLMRELTDRDPLTGVLTRSAFESRVRHRAESDRRADRRAVSLVLLDLDHFKRVNDTHGHVAGDRVLTGLGTFLRRRLRHSDMIGRYGGEEFALLIEEASVADAVRLMERLLAEFREIEHGPAGHVEFSAGVAALTQSFDASFRRADSALYEAKRSGRARIVAA
jgi:diguanylate cyclase (GGDEF)-like protein